MPKTIDELDDIQMTRFITIHFLLTALLALPAEQAQAGPNAKSNQVAAFLQQLDVLREEAHIPGLSVAVLRDQSIVLAAGLGYANVEAGIPAGADTAYDIASVAKPLSAVVAFRLVEEGMLVLDRPIVEYSEWKAFCIEFSQQSSIFAGELRCLPPNHTLRHLLSHTATGTPGTRFSYNPILYSWASRPIMAAANTPFSTLVERYVFAPAGMSESARRHRDLPLREDLAMRMARPYRIDDSGTIQQAPARSPQGDGAAGGVVSTVLDLARFDIALDRGMLISAQSRDEMMTPTKISDGAIAPYGLGWFVQDYQGRTLVWHSGWWEDAWSALYLKIPKLDLTFIVLANSEGVWWDNPLERAEVERSRFAQAFLSAFADR